MAVNEVVYNGKTLINLTDDTVTPATLALGKTAHDATGAIIVGTATPVELVQELGTNPNAVMSQKAIADEFAKRGQASPLYANSIEECTDTTKLYVLPDGMIYAYMLTEVEVETGGGYTNALDEVGYNINQRWSHSGKKLTDADGYVTSNLIPVTTGQTIYINKPDLQSGVFRGGHSRVTYYDASGNYVAGELDRGMHTKVVLTSDGTSYTSFVVGYTMSTAGDASTNTKMTGADNIVSMRLVLNIGNAKVITEEDVADLIVSVGNPIEEGGTEIITDYAWVNTEHAFVPADYEDRIIDVENTTEQHTKEIKALEKAITSGGTDNTEADALNRIKVWDKPVYDFAPVTLLGDDRIKPALTTSDRTISAIYAKYRALMAEYPDIITETNLGLSSSSDKFNAVDILRFDIKESDGLTSASYNPNNLHETKPKIIFMSGVHTEWVGIWGLYYAIEEIVTNPDFDDIRRNAHIIVVPCSNPFVLTSQTAIDGWRMSHVNANGVAIHNNFGVDHSTSGTVGEYNYGGSAPYSEPETQYIDKIMADNPDAVAFVSCHNNDYSTEFGTPVIWASSATYHMCNVVFRLADKLSKAWINKYGDTLISAIDTIRADFPALKEGDYRLGRATMSSSKGTEQKNATKYGIQGVNVEIARMMKVFSGNTDGTSEVMTHGAEVYANLMRTLLSTYDHKDKKEYAPNLPWKE